MEIRKRTFGLTIFLFYLITETLGENSTSTLAGLFIIQSQDFLKQKVKTK